MKTVFKITIKNWTKHNSNKKKNHRYFLLENRFFNDTKILNCSALDTMLFINCLCIASDLCSDCIEVSVKSFSPQLRLTSNSLQTRLETLQQLQLVSYEKKDSLLIQEKRKQEKTGKQDKLPSDFDLSKNSEKLEPENLQFFHEKINEKKDDFADFNLKESCKKVWEAYNNSYVLRYGIEPKRNVKVNSQIKQLTQRLGHEDAIKTVEFYLTHNDSQFLKNSHSIGLCLLNAENLFSQMQRGVQITHSQIKNLEKAIESKEQLDYFERKYSNEIK